MRPLLLALAASLVTVSAASAQWVTRDERRAPRGEWNWALPRELPALYREFNGIDFGHAHLAQALLGAQDSSSVETARLQVLEFIFSGPEVPPDEELVAPDFARAVWEAQRAFGWAHQLHRSLYDLFASDRVEDKDAAYRQILADYLSKPEAITSHALDHHGALWGFPESRAFSKRFPKFNAQIWAYHWLQAAVYDVQVEGGASLQREQMPKVISWYHGYLANPPLDWQFMPLMREAAPAFAERFPEAAVIFDNLHMLHDNVDDVLSSPEIYTSLAAKRSAVVGILDIYLHRNHEPGERYGAYHARNGHGDGHMETGPAAGRPMGVRPPSAREVLEGTAVEPVRVTGETPSPGGGHEH